MSRPNEKQINEQRDKYVDEAVQKVISEKKYLGKDIEAILQTDRDVGIALGLLCNDVIQELKEKQGITKESPKETVREFNEEYNRKAVEKRIIRHLAG